MAGKEKALTFEFCIRELGRAFGYQDGQELQTSVDRLRQYFQPPLYDDATLLEVMRCVDPTYTITQQDQEQREARRALSERARDNFYTFLHRKLEVGSIANLERGLEMLFDYSGTPEAAAHNQQIRAAFEYDENHQFKSNDIEERTRLMKEFIDKMEKDDFSALVTATDEQLVEQFPKMYSLYILCAEGGDGLLNLNRDAQHPTANGYQLDETYVQKLGKYKGQYQTLLGELKARFDMIMDPNYELIHTERLLAPNEDYNPTNSLDPSGIHGELEFIKKIGDADRDSNLLYPDETNFAQLIQNAYAMPGLGYQDKVSHFARTKGIEPQDLQLLKADGTPVDPTQLRGVSMITAKDGKTGKEFLLQSDGVNLSEFDATKALSTAKKGGKSIIEDLEAADPWNLRIFAGSREFAAMKRQMKAVDKIMDGLEKPVSEDEFNKAQAMLSDLAQKTQDYLLSKGIMNDDTKDSERARIMAAKRVQEYAETKALLLNADKNLDLERQARRDVNNTEMGKNLDAEYDFSGGRGILKNNMAEPAPEADDLKREVRALDGKVMKTYNNLEPGDPLRGLGRSIFMELDRELYVKASPNGRYHTETPKFSLLSAPEGVLADAMQWKTLSDLNGLKGPVEPKNAKKDLTDMMTRMVTFDLIMRERADNLKAGKKEVGPLESRFKEVGELAFRAEIGKSKHLQELASNITAKDFRALVGRAAGGDGIQNLTNKILLEYAAAQKPAQNNPQELQVQNGLQNQAQPQAQAQPPEPKPVQGPPMN